MIDRLLYRLTAGLPARLITLDSGPYLERYYVGQLFGITFYLHRFVSPDTERHLHNHPWTWGRALVLHGAYDEDRVIDLTTASESGCITETRRIRWWNHVNGNDFHRITNARRGTWTLFFHGPRSVLRCGMVDKPKHWGFLTRSEDHNHVIFVPFSSASTAWWENAPRGRDVGREPFRPRTRSCGGNC